MHTPGPNPGGSAEEVRLLADLVALVYFTLELHNRLPAPPLVVNIFHTVETWLEDRLVYTESLYALLIICVCTFIIRWVNERLPDEWKNRGQ